MENGGHQGAQPAEAKSPLLLGLSQGAQEIGLLGLDQDQDQAAAAVLAAEIGAAARAKGQAQVQVALWVFRALQDLAGLLVLAVPRAAAAGKELRVLQTLGAAALQDQAGLWAPALPQVAPAGKEEEEEEAQVLQTLGAAATAGRIPGQQEEVAATGTTGKEEDGSKTYCQARASISEHAVIDSQVHLVLVVLRHDMAITSLRDLCITWVLGMLIFIPTLAGPQAAMTNDNAWMENSLSDIPILLQTWRLVATLLLALAIRSGCVAAGRGQNIFPTTHSQLIRQLFRASRSSSQCSQWVLSLG